MKKIILFLIFGPHSFHASQAQQPSPHLLKEPTNWAFERFPLPPAFAPAFPFKGVEGLRFTPGIFDKDSADYFTYAFVAELANAPAFSRGDLRNYLLNYFKGLCGSTALDRKLVIDTSAISVFIDKKKDTQDKEIYDAVLNVFGVFADGAPVKLNAEIKVSKDIAAKITYLIFIASPKQKTSTSWTQLYRIQRDFQLPLP